MLDRIHQLNTKELFTRSKEHAFTCSIGDDMYFTVLHAFDCVGVLAIIYQHNQCHEMLMFLHVIDIAHST